MAEPIPVFLDTDIGTSIDDLFALAFVLGSPEMRLVGVTIVSGDVRQRAALALTALALAGRLDVPVSIGAAHPVAPGSRSLEPPVGHGLDLSVSGLPPTDRRTAAMLLLEKAAEHPGVLSVVGVGPLTNLARMARDHPYAFRSLGCVSLMGGNFQGTDARSIAPETNFRLDPQAADLVLNSGARILLCGLNVTRRLVVTSGQIDGLESIGTPRAAFLASAARSHLQAAGRAQTPMHDVLAAAALIRPDIVSWRLFVARVQTAGPGAGVVTFRKAYHARDCSVQTAVDVDVAAFQSLFWERITAFARET